jgi:hypothetical protein
LATKLVSRKRGSAASVVSAAREFRYRYLVLVLVASRLAGTWRPSGKVVDAAVTDCRWLYLAN